MAEDLDFQNRMRKIETLIQTIEDTADPDARANARELVQTILELHGVGLIKIMEFANQAGNQAMIDWCARDDLVGSLLLLHGIHPLDQQTRIEQALERLRPRLFVHGGRVELMGIDKNVVRVRLHTDSSAGPAEASAARLKQWIEEAICAAAPEVTMVECIGDDHVATGLLSLPIIAGEYGRG